MARNAQHFLKSSRSRTLSALQVARMSDEEAEARFRRMRWPDTDGAPVCPHCGHTHVWEQKTRKLFKCAACRKQFSVTSGTIFHSTKMPLKDVLAVIGLFANASKGISALQVSRDIGRSYKACFVLLHKLREAVADGRAMLRLNGIVEIDGAYYGGSTRAGNVGREGQRPENRRKKRCVLTLAERGGATATVVIKSENTDDILEAVRTHVVPTAEICADEHASYDALHAGWRVHRINHRWMWADAGVSTNQAEAFHSRMRRSEIGQYHRFSGAYLDRYASEIAWRNDRRRTPNGVIFDELGEMAAMHPISRKWTGYWQARV